MLFARPLEDFIALGCARTRRLPATAAYRDQNAPHRSRGHSRRHGSFPVRSPRWSWLLRSRTALPSRSRFRNGAPRRRTPSRDSATAATHPVACAWWPRATSSSLLTKSWTSTARPHLPFRISKSTCRASTSRLVANAARSDIPTGTSKSRADPRPVRLLLNIVSPDLSIVRSATITLQGAQNQIYESKNRAFDRNMEIHRWL